jgi:hypothetical protein
MKQNENMLSRGAYSGRLLVLMLSFVGLMLICIGSSSRAYASHAVTVVYPYDLEFTISVDDSAGLPFDGDMKFYVSQAQGYGYKEWGPIEVAVTGGQATFLTPLQGFDFANEAVLSGWPIDSNGMSSKGVIFFSNASDGVVCSENFQTGAVNSNGEYPVLLSSLILSEPPFFGDVTLTSQGTDVGVSVVLFERYLPGSKKGGSEILGTVGVKTDLYGWTDSQKIGYVAKTPGGWSVDYGAIDRGGSVTEELNQEGALRVFYDSASHPEVITTHLYPQDSYQPLVLTGMTPTQAWHAVSYQRDFLYIGKVEGIVGTMISDTEVLFQDIPEGEYVVEFWTERGLDVSPPAPAYTAVVTIVGGQEVVVSDTPVGVKFCYPADINSTGFPAEITGTFGSGIGANLHIEAKQGVPGLIGYLLIGTGVDDPGLAISEGHLCLAMSGSDLFGRYNVLGGVLNSVGVFDSSGILQNASNTSTTGTGYDVPLDIPITGYTMIVSGETWNFQLWYRNDTTGTSNFSNGLTVLFP